MASKELIISEKEWQDLVAVKVYAKTLFDVDITRKDLLDLCDSKKSSSSLSLSNQTKSQTSRKDPHADCNSYDPGGELSKELNFYLNDPGGVPSKGLDLTEQTCYGDDVLSPPPVIALLETKTSSENLEKCRKFICAFNPSHPDYRKVTLHINSQELLEMVRDSVTRIQQSTAALIGIHQDQMDVSIQGHHCCVEAASEILRHGFKLDSLETDGQAHSSCVDLVAKSHKATKTDTCNEKSSLWLESQMSLESNTIPRPLFSNIIQTAQNDNTLNETNEVMSNAHGDLIDSPQQHLREPCENSCDSLSEGDDDVLDDERLKKHIDQASKCGFCDRQISNVLQRLGVNCSMDDMMRELVKEPQVVENDDFGSDSKETESVVGDIASKEHEADEEEEDFNVDDSSNLRHIVIDGSNVAMSHGQKIFSCMGIKIVVEWFKKRGHQNITVFVPQWRKEASRPDAPISNQEILTELEEERVVVFTPSRRVGGTRIVCYDDRYVLQLAAQTDGIVVSNDVYRDLMRERDDFREVVEKRLLMYSFVKDTFMPPEDPLGRQGPSLDNLLRIRQAEPRHRPQNCPYGKKCTYGNKCKYYHPERRYGPQKMVAEKLKESAELKLKLGSGAFEKGKRPKQKLSRTLSMLPQEFDGRAYSDETNTEMHRKPPLLQHSKSLVYPSSYLTELRLKMEQAESEETSTTLSDCRFEISSPEQISGKDVDVINDTTQHFSASCNVSPCASPVAANDLAKPKITAVRSFPLSPIRNLSPFAGPIDPPVTISNPENQVRYLSGHLFIAKKLSDEESNHRNFFSQHTSRVPGSQGKERKGPCYEDRLSSAATVSSPTGGSTSTINKPQTSSQSQPHAAEDNSRDAFGYPEIFFPPEIPTTSASRDQKACKEDKPALSHSHPLTTTTFREDGAYPTHSLNSSVSNNCDSSSQPPPQLQFTRSMSSTAPSPSQFSSDHHHLRRPLDRKVSLGNISSLPPKVQSGMGGSFSSNPYLQQSAKFPFPPPIQRMQGSFDSGVSSGFYSEQSHGMFSPTEDSVSPFQNSPKVSSPALFSPTHNPAQLMMQQQQHQRRMYHSSPPPPPTTMPFVYQMGADGSTASPAYSGCPPFNPWQWQQQPHQMTSRMPFDHLPYSSHSPIQTSPSPAAAMPPLTHSPLYSSADIGMNYPTQQGQQHYHQTANPMVGFASPDGSYYPVPGQGAYVTSPFSYETNAPPHSPFAQAPPSTKPAAKVIDEEAPINVADPRYPIYYHLSSIFGERVVRTFMNRNPDVSGINVKELYSLISVYKQEMGM